MNFLYCDDDNTEGKGMDSKAKGQGGVRREQK